MSNPDFASILDEAPATTERPKPLPAGTYLAVVKGQPRYDKSSKKQTPFVEFTLQPTAAMEDVDQEELTTMGGFANKTIRATYYITEDAKWRLKDFLSHCGIDVDSMESYRTAIDEAMNSQVLATLRHRASDDGQAVFAELAKTAPAE